MNKIYFIYQKLERTKISAIELEKVRLQKKDFDLWCDVEKRQLILQDKITIDIFDKRILCRLLCYLVMNAGKCFTAEELYPPIWCLNVFDCSEECVVKTAISRLRSLLNDNHKDWKIIKKTKPSIFGRRGEYYFNANLNYCLFYPIEYQLFEN